MFFLDPRDRLFEKENTIELFTKNTDNQPATTESNNRRVISLFGDTNPEGYYYEPQRITDDALLSVSFVLIIINLILVFFIQNEHHDTLTKLQFILQLVEYILNLAGSRSSLLAEPIILSNKNSQNYSRPKPDRLSHVDDLLKRAETLTLYVKAMHFLSSALCLTR